MKDVQERWDGIFLRPGRRSEGDDRWLERWQADVLETSRDVPILELGSGGGLDARFLTEQGFAVLATDFSEEALELTRQQAPKAGLKRLDFTLGLPFPDGSFRVIVASLSLHYFPWRQTLEIIGDVRRCLKPGGHLLARFNSTKDAYYAGVEKEEVEENFYVVGGMPKRLFDRRSIEALFATGWELVSATERVTRKYGHEKTVWEIAARRTGPAR
jgi:SAM-dependent methyltransferase